MRELELLTNYLDSWLKENHFDFPIYYDDFFYADLDRKCIGYSLTDSEEGIDEFLKNFYDNGVKVSVNYFTSAFFHELGHLITLPQLTSTDLAIWDYAYGNESVSQKDYFNVRCEKLATEWAIDFINSNVEKIEEFMIITTTLSNMIYEINHIDTQIRDYILSV